MVQALIARDVIGDFRAPNVMHFGFTPIYLDETDVCRTVDILAEVLDNRLWDTPEFQSSNRVT